jgi:DMSO/TMAO reductase YedYZ molybdopterin-dependent catalytic subunit
VLYHFGMRHHKGLPDTGRREFMAAGAGALAAFSQLLHAASEGNETVIPFLDSPAFNPEKPRLPWDETTAWMTPKEHIFFVGHYGIPAAVDPNAWKLEIKGLVEKPQTLSLNDLRKRTRREHIATIECSGNPPAGGMVANARWAGTPLAPVLKECGIKPEAIEVVFFCSDEGTEKIRGGDYKQNFARSLAMSDASNPNVLLAYEMNGEPLAQVHGAPVRLVVPGWYGVAWVKWLNRIELHDRRYMGRFMGRDYVTIRGEQQGDQTIWRETSVGRMNLKSIVARVARQQDGVLRVSGAAWSDGTPIKSVEVKVDDGPWTAVKLGEHGKDPYSWTFWTYDWKGAAAGEHTLASRATDAHGKVQPAPDDPFITQKKTYWEANQQAVRKIRV